VAKVVVSLTEKDVVRLQAVLLDKDAEEALAFLREVVAPQAIDLDRKQCRCERRQESTSK